MSGLLSCVFIYPSDVIKSKIQGSTKVTIYLQLLKIFIRIMELRFFRGFHYAMLRAVPLHAGTFYDV